MLFQYATMKRLIEEKRRGRSWQVNVNKSPPLWASMQGPDVVVKYDGGGNTVARLHPDNSMVLTVSDWATQLTIKILNALNIGNCYISKGMLWIHDYPCDGPTWFDRDRRFIPPQKFVRISTDALFRLKCCDPHCLPPPQRLQFEIGEWSKSKAITQRVLDYATGQIPIERLSMRDVWTCMNCQAEIIHRVLERSI